MKFTYTAPEKKAPIVGFATKATSRAGLAEGEWKAGLGTGWGGQISCSQENSDGGQVEVQSFSMSQKTNITIDVKNGVGTAHGFAETNEEGVNRQPAFRGGAKTMIVSDSHRANGSVEASSPAKVEVFFNKPNGTYSISLDFTFTAEGKIHLTDCGRDGGNCRESDMPIYVASCIGSALSGKFTDFNHVSGSVHEEKTGGRSGKGTGKWTVTWNLARQGAAQ